MAERYLCLNCNHIGIVNVHGRCTVCNSTVVVSLEKQRHDGSLTIKKGAGV
jgi:hypothetical protein